MVDTCNSVVELDMLARGMAKQHETYQDALQELIDNAISSIVSDERYFENPDQPIEISIDITRNAATVTTTIADNGPGIPPEVLRDHVFRTGNKEKSEGILNNVGWGLKASFAWFEETVRQSRIEPEDPWFTLVTQTARNSPVTVEGPITGNLPIRDADRVEWVTGVQHGGTSLHELDHGTRVQVSCARGRFDSDVWPSAERLDIKVQALRERLGVLFRRLLTAHEDNRIVLSYNDVEEDTQGTLDVIPIFPKYRTDIESRSEGTPPHEQIFELTTQSGTFTIEYECGTLDFDAMTDAVAEDNPGLLTHGGNFRTRYRPSQATQGVDIYANGRVLMTSVFSELFDLSRNNQYNYFGGTLRIIPKNSDIEVPTDNKKTRIDTNSELWRQLEDRFSNDEYQPAGKRYDTSDSEGGKASGFEASGAKTDTDPEIPANEESSTITTKTRDAIRPNDRERYGLIQGDSHRLTDQLSYFGKHRLEEDLVDVTITSPPYADMKDYGYDPNAQVGLQEGYGEYLSDLQDIFSQVYDITKPDGSLWVVVNTFKKDGEITQLPADIASVCQQLEGVPDCPTCSSEDQTVPLVPQATGQRYRCRNCGHRSTGKDDSWILQDIIIWDKNRALPYSDTRFRNVFEYILCFSKQPDFRFDLDSVRLADPNKFKSWWVDYPERYHPKGIVPENIWSMTTPSQGAFGDGVLDHPAPFPPDLVGRIVNLTTSRGDVVFDPFAGSGTVLAQADVMGRRPLGFELSYDYCDAYESVKQQFAEKWTSHRNSSYSEQQDQLVKTIGRLRQIKQVRELLRHLADAQGASEPAQLDIEGAIHIEEQLNQKAVGSGTFIEMSIIFTVDHGVTAQRAAALETTAAKLLSKNPLSGYGINTTLQVMTPAELQSAGTSGEYPALQGELFVYADGRHYEFADTTTLDSWIEEGSSEFPSRPQSPSIQPILSHLDLRVQNPRRESSRTSTSTEPYQKDTAESNEQEIASHSNVSNSR
jgi:DNA modification methylase